MQSKLSKNTILLLIAAMGLPLGIAGVEASTQCLTGSLACASVTGSTTDFTGTHCCPNPHQDTQVHCQGTHTALLNGASGRCQIEGSQVDSCPIGATGGSCSTHGHSTYHFTVSGQCWQVRAETSATAGTVADAHFTCT